MRRRDHDDGTDPDLASALREILEGEHHDAFIDRVMAHCERIGIDGTRSEYVAPTWNVLAAWSRLGIVAAIFVVLLAGVLVAPFAARDGGPDSLLAASTGEGQAALLADNTPPDASVLFDPGVEP